MRVGVSVNSDISSLDGLASAGTARTYVDLAWAGVMVGALRPVWQIQPVYPVPIILLSLSFPAVDFDLLFITARNYVCIFIPQFQLVALYHSVRPLVSSATS